LASGRPQELLIHRMLELLCVVGRRGSGQRVGARWRRLQDVQREVKEVAQVAKRQVQPRQLTVVVPQPVMEALERISASQNLTPASFVEARLADLVTLVREARRHPKAPPENARVIGYL
jgi:hypothetical protein